MASRDQKHQLLLYSNKLEARCRTGSLWEPPFLFCSWTSRVWNVPDTLVPRSGKLYQQDLCASSWQKCLTYFMSVSVFSSPAEVGVLTPCSDANKTIAQREEIADPLSSCWESWGQDFALDQMDSRVEGLLLCWNGDITLRARQWRLGTRLLRQAVPWLPQLERLSFLEPTESTLRWDATVCQNIELLCTCLRCSGPWLCSESLRRTYIALLNKSQAPPMLSTASLQCPDLLGGLRVSSSGKK